MSKKTAQKSKQAVSATQSRWASDVIVDLLHAYDLPHAALNPMPINRLRTGSIKTLSQ